MFDLRCHIMRSTQAESFLFRLHNVECPILLFCESGYQLTCILLAAEGVMWGFVVKRRSPSLGDVTYR